jgi:hypothetical protein
MCACALHCNVYYSYGYERHGILNDTGSNITLQAMGDEGGFVLIDASPSSICNGCPVLESGMHMQIAQYL